MANKEESVFRNIIKKISQGFLYGFITLAPLQLNAAEPYNGEKVSEAKKQALVEEFIKVAQNNRLIKTVLTNEEIKEKMNSNIVEIETKVQAIKEEGNYARYDTKRRKIYTCFQDISSENKDIFFHELVHALFRREEFSTGLQSLNTGIELNEGATQFITDRLIPRNNETKYNYEIEVFEKLCMIYGMEFMMESLKHGYSYFEDYVKQDEPSVIKYFVFDLQTIAKRPRVSFNKQKKDRNFVEEHKKSEEAKIQVNRVLTNLLYKKYMEADFQGKLDIRDNIIEMLEITGKDIGIEQGINKNNSNTLLQNVEYSASKEEFDIKVDFYSVAKAILTDKYLENKKEYTIVADKMTFADKYKVPVSEVVLTSAEPLNNRENREFMRDSN